MTMVMLVLTMIGGVAALAGFLWLVVIAFKEHVGWGIACLVVPLVVLVFAFRYWERAKVPLLLGLSGSLLSAVAGIGYTMTAVNRELEEYSDLGTAVAWESPSVEPYDLESETAPMTAVPDGLSEDSESPPGTAGVTATDDAGTAADADTIPEKDTVMELLEGDTDFGPPPRPHRDGYLVPASDLGAYTGDTVVIVLDTHERIFALVVSVEGSTVKLQHRVGGGSVIYTIDMADIKEVRSRRPR